MIDAIEWFDSLAGPKYLEVMGETVSCVIGLNRTVADVPVRRVKADVIEAKGSSISEVLQDAKNQWELLTTDVLFAD